MLEKLFKLRENGTDAKTEVMAGRTYLQSIRVSCLQQGWIPVQSLHRQRWLQ